MDYDTVMFIRLAFPKQERLSEFILNFIHYQVNQAAKWQSGKCLNATDYKCN